MKHGIAFVLVLGLVACEREPTAEPARFALGAVVEGERARLAEHLPPKSVPSEPDAEARAYVLGLLETFATPGKLGSAARTDLVGAGPQAVDVLARLVLDTHAEARVRSAAIEALSLLKLPSAGEALVHGLEASAEPWVRAQCAWRIGSIEDDRWLPRLLLRLKYEVDRETATWLADSVARLGNYSGVSALRVIRAEVANAETSAAAAARLEELAARAGVANGDVLIEGWFDGSLESRLAAPAPSDLLRLEIWNRIAGLAEWDLRKVDDCRFVLAQMNAWVVPLLASALHDANVYTRTHAAQCLERMGRRAAAAGPELVAALGEPRLAPGAATALGALQHVAAVEPLEIAAERARDTDLRAAATRALGALHQPRSLPVLRRIFLSDAAQDLRQAAAEALVDLGAGDEVAKFLHTCLAERTGDLDAAEAALERWLRAKAATPDPTFAEILARWTAVAPALGSIETRAQVDERHRTRADAPRAVGSEVRTVGARRREPRAPQVDAARERTISRDTSRGSPCRTGRPSSSAR